MKKRLTSLFLVVAMLVTMLPGNAITALASEVPTTSAYTSEEPIEEKETGEAEDAKAGTVDGAWGEAITTDFLTYNSGADATPVTRLEWLTALVETFEMTVEADNYPDNYFSDLSSESEDYETIMVATEFGLVDVSAGDALCPTDAATREFAAHSLNLCLGYTNTSESYTFSESGSVTYPDDIQVAVDKGWFTLTDGAFLPENALTVTEKTALLETAQTVYASTELDADHVNTWELADGVIDLTVGVQAEMTEENEYTLTNCSYALKVGDVYAVLIDGVPLVKKVVSFTANGTTYVIQTEDVDYQTAFKSLDVQGSAESDLTQTIACSQDVQIEYVVGGTVEEKWQDGEIYSSSDALGMQKADAIIVTKSMEIPVEVKKKYDIADGVTADITCTVSDPYVEYDASVFTSNPYAYVDVNAYVTFSCNVSIDVLKAMGVAPSVQLAKVPLAYGLGYFKVTLDMTFKGSVTLSLVEYVEVGVQVDSENGFRSVKHFQKESFTISAHAEASVGIRATIGANVLNVLKADLYATVGAKAVLDAQTYDDGELPLACTHINAWLYVTVGGSATFNYGWGSKDWSFKKEIYNQRNSPVRVSFHYEDGAEVNRCTREATGTGGSTNSNTSAGRWKYYTPANSRYGYNGSSSGTGSDGQTYTIFEYTLNDANEATITKYNGNVSALNIPSTLDGYPVVGIGSSAFKGNTQLRVVVIPDSVTSIGNNAFNGCNNLSSVELSKCIVSIGYSVFYNCDNMTSIEIPKSLKSVEVASSYTSDLSGWQGVFNNCDNLKEVDFEEGVTKIPNHLFANCTGLEQIEIPSTVTTIEKYAFFRCENLRNVAIPESVVGIGTNAFYECILLDNVSISKGVKTIGEYAFAKCNGLTKVVFADSVETIGNWAFSECGKLEGVELPKKIVTIGYSAFYNCDSLTSIEIPKSLKNVTIASSYTSDLSSWQGVFNNCDNLKEVDFEEGVTKIANHLFANCTGLEQIEIPDTVTIIEKSAFFRCKNLRSVTMHESVTEIGISSFSECSLLNNVSIPNSVNTIDEYAFEKCYTLSQITFADGLETIDSWAFSECSKLEEIKLPKKIVTIGYSAFYNCDSLTSVEIPKSLKSVTIASSYTSDLSGWQGAFNNCDNLKEVDFEEGVTKIVNHLFANCSGLEKIKIPNTVTSIEQYAFYNCVNLTQVEIVSDESLTVVNNRAFYNCISLKEIVVPDSVTAMGTYIFAGCTKLQKAVLPASRIYITEGTFQNCTSLTDITIPSNVQYIRKYAFQNSGLTKVTLPDSVVGIEDYAFKNCDSLAEFNIGENSKLQTIGSQAFYSCAALTAINIPNTVTSLGTYIFAECDSLADVTLGTGITTIPSYAFNLCPALEKIVIPYRVTTINSNAFTNCTKLTEVTIPRATTSIASGVFSYPSKMTIYGITGTYAETYANENSITFVNKEVPATALEIQSTELQIMKGNSARLVLKITPADFTDTITWRSSDTAVATVSDGMVTAVAVGTATISALAGDTGEVKATCTVTVVQPVTSVSIDKSSITLEGGDTYTLTATVYPDTAHDKSLVWTSSDETVATVSQEGVVTALKKGTAKITATAQDGSGKYDYCNVTVNSTAHIVTSVEELQSEHPYTNSINEVWIYTVEDADGLDVMFNSATSLDDGYDFVYIYDGEGNQIGKYTGTQLAGQTIRIPGNTVKIQLITDSAITGWGFKVDAVVKAGESIELESISLDKTELVLKPQETGTLIVSYNPTNATVDRTVTWSSSDEKIATVAGDGTVTAVAIGIATITAKVGEKEATCLVTVTQDAESITLSSTELKLHDKETATLTYAIAPDGARVKTLQAVSSDETVACVTVAEDLKSVEVTGLKAGKAEITLTADDKLTAVCTITVVDTITLDYQDGTGKTEQIKAAYGEALSALGDIEPVREGYLFVGWYTEPNGRGTKITKDTVLTDQWILYAYWRSADAEFWVEPVEEQIYTGKAVKPAVVVYDGLTLLEEKKDYTISYKNNVKANDATDAQKAPTIIVKGKGNYTGKVSVTFRILPQNIEDEAFVVDDLAVKYNAKKVQKVTPAVLWNGKKLKLNKDFVVEGGDGLKAPGTYPVKVTGIGNFTGERVINFTITEGLLMSKVKVAKIPNQTYQKGNPITPVLTVKNGKETLTKGVHYEVEYESNSEVGTATAVIIGKTGYSGVKRVKFKIVGTSLAKATVDGLTDKVYDGSAQKQSMKLKLNIVENGQNKTVELVEGRDYTVSYSKNTNVGKASLVIKGIGAYTGTIKKSFKINASNMETGLTNLRFVVDGQTLEGSSFLNRQIEAAYTKGGSKPSVEIYAKSMNKWLVEGKDFTVTYAQNKTLTTATTKKQPVITIKGKGNFAGSLTKNFKIVPKSLADVKVSAEDKMVSTKAGGYLSKPILTDVDGKKLKEKTDYIIAGYTVRYADGRTEDVDAKSVVAEIGAKVTVKVVGQGAYAGTATESSEVYVTYRITAKSMKGIKVSTITKEYTGEEITLSAEDFVNADGSSKVTVKENGVTKNLVYGKDFEIVEGSYAKNIKKGTATVSIKGLGEYGGTMKIKFKIKQKWIFFDL